MTIGSRTTVNRTNKKVGSEKNVEKHNNDLSHREPLSKATR